jgi:leader peptidase (prepilin peptidase)/N-methyltransferase
VSEEDVVIVPVATGALGLVIGSFLNVVAWRLPRGESIVTPGSRCPACQHPIRVRDNVPVVSWLALKGRCRDCAAPISPRYPVVEVLTGLLFAVLAIRFGTSAALAAYLYLAGAGVALTLIDLDVRRLPNAIVLPSYAVGLALLGLAALADRDPGAFGRAVLGMAALFAFYFLLALAYPAGMGFGDVKLSGVLGLYLGYLGVGELLVGAFAGFLLGGLAGAALVVLRRAGRKTAIPFGPFMLAGALVGILAGHPLADAYLSGVLR